jgi:hypothetical protein
LGIEGILFEKKKQKTFTPRRMLAQDGATAE